VRAAISCRSSSSVCVCWSSDIWKGYLELIELLIAPIASMQVSGLKAMKIMAIIPCKFATRVLEYSLGRHNDNYFAQVHS
jgi:hypothetical protein